MTLVELTWGPVGAERGLVPAVAMLVQGDTDGVGADVQACMIRRGRP